MTHGGIIKTVVQMSEKYLRVLFSTDEATEAAWSTVHKLVTFQSSFVHVHLSTVGTAVHALTQTASLWIMTIIC